MGGLIREDWVVGGAFLCMDLCGDRMVGGAFLSFCTSMINMGVLRIEIQTNLRSPLHFSDHFVTLIVMAL